MSNPYRADVVAQYDRSFTEIPLRRYVELPSVDRVLGRRKRTRCSGPRGDYGNERGHLGRELRSSRCAGITSGSLATHARQLGQPVEHERDLTTPCVSGRTHQCQGLAIGMNVVVVVERGSERLDHQPLRQHANA